MNSVQLEILKIDEQWYNVIKENPDKPMFICLGEKAELKLFDTYVKSRAADEVYSKDVFLVHYQNFESAKTYGETLTKDMVTAYNLWRKAMPEEAKGTSEWIAEETDKKQRSDASKTFETLNRLYSVFPLLKNHYLFILLSPQKIDDMEQMEIWLQDWCDNASNDRIKIILSDNVSARLFINMPQGCHTFQLDEIDMGALMKNVEEQTTAKDGTEDADNDFQQQLLTANAYLCQGKYENAYSTLEKAVKIARTRHLPEAECSARLIMVQLLSINKKREAAEEQFKIILKLASANPTFEGQMYMHYGGFLLSQSEKEKGINAFLHAAEISAKNNNSFLQMECYRIVGQLKDGKIRDSEAISYYEKCLEIGRNMKAENRKNSSLSFVAGLLMEKYGDTKEAELLNKEMNELVGADWHTQTKAPTIDGYYYNQDKKT